MISSQNIYKFLINSFKFAQFCFDILLNFCQNLLQIYSYNLQHNFPFITQLSRCPSPPQQRANTIYYINFCENT